MRELKKRLKELLFNLPNTIFFEERKEGIRVSSKKLMGIKVKGKRGIIAFKKGDLTQQFILAFGKYSSKGIMLSDDQFILLSDAKSFNVDAEDGDYISFFNNFPVCLISVRNKLAYPKIEKGFKRKIKNLNP